MVGLVSIESNALRASVFLNGLFEEALCGSLVAFIGVEKLDSVPRAIDGAVKISPTLPDLDISFIDKPTPARRIAPPVECFPELWCKTDNPAMDGGMIDAEPAFTHHLFEIA